ncbi:glycerophosphodiester phosphodiesterase [Paenibacillus lupini]|uniref:glycerophosphodiester phosphodiesterase n=1 Tax=Paenibacillus lupini TaxID=1450204 RepID=UPI001FBBB997|nr:glycerophosphodiester phosphodiesterase [Paenibacillus lupini]NIK26560.1 glycerophosphoryl diester phosphodiesterase [Paenibacillus lupini]
MKRPMIGAHTGSGASPDNTLASFMEGVQSGADIVEVDVHAAMDGTAVLLHDDSPYLLTCTFEQLNQPEMRRRLSPTYAEHEIATLEQIFQISDRLGTKLNIDLKSADSIEPAVKLIRQYGAWDRVHITGYSETMTARFPDIPVMINTKLEIDPKQLEQYDKIAQRICEAARREGYTGLNMNYRTCFEPIVETAHKHGLTLWVYTVNEPTQMERFIRMGVDAITTRKPETLLSLLRQ